jgi:hypothetical protein
MKKSLLVTSGCSWTYGVGAGYQDGMSLADYEKIAWDNNLCNQLSFRGILSAKYDLDNINLAEGGDSNQRQFRLIKNFFSSTQTKKLFDNYDRIFVLHGITSTARNELYIVERKYLTNFKFDGHDNTTWCKAWVKNFYDHNNELERLAEEMTFLNDYYQAVGVENLWYDTFNHHNYPAPIDKMIEPDKDRRDLLSSMLIKLGITDMDNNYHLSSWKVDTDRVDTLIKMGYLNPFSKHPTQLGHELIAQIVDEFFGKLYVKTTI